MVYKKSLTVLLIFLSMLVSKSNAQSDSNYYMNDYNITAEEWQKQMDVLIEKKIKAETVLFNNKKEKDSLSAVKKNVDSIRSQLQTDIYNLVEANKNEVSEFDDRFATTEKKILSESAPLKDIKEYWFDWIAKNKIRLLQKYNARYTVMKEKLENWKGE